MCSKLRIIHELSYPFTSQQNGKAEREIRTLTEATATILIETGLEKKFWAEIMIYVVFVINRTGKSSIEGRTPYEIMFKSNFDYRELKPFGTEAYMQIPKSNRTKIDPRGEKGIFYWISGSC